MSQFPGRFITHLAHRRKVLVWMALLASVLILLSLGADLVSQERLPVDDFVEYWAAGRQNLAGGNPYDLTPLAVLERAAGRTTPPLMMWNPPYVLILLAPLSLFDYPISRLLWLALNVGMILVSADWLWELFDGPREKRWVAAALSVTFFPALIVLRMGQIAPFLLFGLVGFLRFERKGRYGLAGGCMALLAIKPHLLYLVLLAIAGWSLRRKRWGVLGGAALMVTWATLMVVVVNPHVLIQYMRANVESSPLIWMTPTFGSVLRLAFGSDAHWLQFLPMVPGVAWLAVYARRHRTGWRWTDHISLLVLVSSTTAPFGWSFDQVVLIPAVLEVARWAMAVPRPRVVFPVAAIYLLLNMGAWAFYGRLSDIWLVWFVPAMLVWYLVARCWLSVGHPPERIVTARYVLAALLVVIGGGLLAKPTQMSFPPYLYHKDVIQEYLMASAVLSGANPYVRLGDLGARFALPLPQYLAAHPSPHPPPAIWLALPLVWMSYETAQAAWFVFELACFIAAIWLVGRAWRMSLRPWMAALIAVATAPLLHVWEELGFGQLMMPLLLLVVGAWYTLRNGNEARGGAWLGLAVALKLLAWPVVVLLALQRRWRAALAAGCTIAVANLTAIALIGPGTVLSYYTDVTRSVLPFYRAHQSNFALASLGWRLFDGTGSTVLDGVQAAPLVAAPSVAAALALILPALWVVLGLALARRVRSFDLAYGMALCVSVLASPIAWAHYLVLLALSVAIAARRVVELGWRRRQVYSLVLTVLTLSVPAVVFSDVPARAALPGGASVLGPTVPFAATLIGLVPTAAVIGFFVLLRGLDRVAGGEETDGCPALAAA